MLWSQLPAGLGTYYNNRAFDERLTDPALAIRDYRRAIDLNPRLPEGPPQPRAVI